MTFGEFLSSSEVAYFLLYACVILFILIILALLLFGLFVVLNSFIGFIIDSIRERREKTHEI